MLIADGAIILLDDYSRLYVLRGCSLISVVELYMPCKRNTGLKSIPICVDYLVHSCLSPLNGSAEWASCRVRLEQRQ